MIEVGGRPESHEGGDGDTCDLEPRNSPVGEGDDDYHLDASDNDNDDPEVEDGDDENDSYLQANAWTAVVKRSCSLQVRLHVLNFKNLLHRFFFVDFQFSTIARFLVVFNTGDISWLDYA